MPAITIEEARGFLFEEDITPLSVVESEEGASNHEASHVSEAHDYSGETVGLGMDIVEIERMQRILRRLPSFVERVFSEDERAYCDSKGNPAVHYALRFAAKEAVVKALGTGFAEGIWVRDIEVSHDGKGRPIVLLYGRADEIARQQGVEEISISLSYTKNDAVACAMAITEGSLRASEKRKDPMEELTLKFKETRKWLDEI